MAAPLQPPAAARCSPLSKRPTGLCSQPGARQALQTWPARPSARRQGVVVAVAQEEAVGNGGGGAAVGGDGLADEVAELRSLVARQQRAIEALEGRLGLGPAAGGAAASRPPASPLDGPAAVLEPSLLTRKAQGSYSSRSDHITSWGLRSRDVRLLPRRIVLVRHAQSKGNVDPFQYTYIPDPSVPLTSKGWEQALDAGERLRGLLERDGAASSRLFFYTSPYLRCKQTTEGLLQAFGSDQVLGVQEEVMLREQDFGNFQDAEGKKREKVERLRYGRFFYRFPHGESGADVYNRMTIFQDHLVRDMDAGRYGEDCTVVLVTHGLASRIFLMRFFHWTVQQFLEVWNPPNAEPIVMELIPPELVDASVDTMHTKALYRLSAASRAMLQGCTEEMCETSWSPRGMHWDQQSDSKPPLVADSLCKEDEQVLGERDGEEARAAA